MHHFTGPDPDISGDSSSFDFFRPMFTEELLSTVLTETNRYCQQYIQRGENSSLQTDLTVSHMCAVLCSKLEGGFVSCDLLYYHCHRVKPHLQYNNKVNLSQL